MKLFNQNAKVKLKSSTFNLSHERKMSLQMGKLYPAFVQEVIPGDKFKNNTEILMRVAPMIAPVMHRVNVFLHFFYVPYRLVWDQWEDFITGGPQGDKTPTWPYVLMSSSYQGNFLKGTLSDYLGLPTLPTTPAIVDNAAISAIPYRVYQLIYDEYYKDQNLIAEKTWTKGGGNVSTELDRLNVLQRRAWMKDYFTSALPWSQRGGDAYVPTQTAYDVPTEVVNLAGDVVPNLTTLTTDASGVLEGGGNPVGLESNLSVQVNELRKAVRLQEWLERSARGGARYIEQILAHWGVVSSDARLQRPRYIGGGMNPVVMSEVLSTFQFSGDAEGMPQGNMSGHGISVGGNMGFGHSFEEHGMIMGLLSVLPNTGYMQGISRMWTRNDKFDYPFPEFANLGEQEILNRELYYDPTTADGWNIETFGYQSRYAEWKYALNSCHGDFRDNLSYWHLDRIFGTRPTLNQTFIEANPDTRIFNVIDQTQDQFYCLLHHSCTAKRKLPYFGTPTI